MALDGFYTVNWPFIWPETVHLGQPDPKLKSQTGPEPEKSGLVSITTYNVRNTLWKKAFLRDNRPSISSPVPLLAPALSVHNEVGLALEVAAGGDLLVVRTAVHVVLLVLFWKKETCFLGANHTDLILYVRTLAKTRTESLHNLMSACKAPFEKDWWGIFRHTPKALRKKNNVSS